MKNRLGILRFILYLIYLEDGTNKASVYFAPEEKELIDSQTLKKISNDQKRSTFWECM